ncbi:MAG: hypothetical protein VXZ11_01975 [Chloroflexota bacterium]|nr:hypothetical protein [Chloroflexota bacterium]
MIIQTISIAMKIESTIYNFITPEDKEFVEILKNNNFKNLEIFLVGGALRDIMLEIPPKELDFCINGEINEFKEFLNNDKQLKIIKVSEFETYKVLFKDKIYDFSVTRKESYIPKGSLPKIDAFNVPIETDLKRRDFTINSIAMNINSDINNLIDPFNGLKDLKNKVIKVIHDESFKDDPTRAYRAVKFSKRYNFEIETNTLNNLIDSVEYIKVLSKERIKNELEKICKEFNFIQILNELKKINILKYFFDFDPLKININNNEIDNWLLLIYEIRKIDYFENNTFFSEYNFSKKLKEKINNLLFIINLIKRNPSNLNKDISENDFSQLKKIDSNHFTLLSMIESNYTKTIIKLKESILNSSANLSFLELKNMKSFTDLKTSNILKEIEFQKFKGIIKSKKDETMYLKKFYI